MSGFIKGKDTDVHFNSPIVPDSNVDNASVYFVDNFAFEGKEDTIYVDRDTKDLYIYKNGTFRLLTQGYKNTPSFVYYAKLNKEVNSLYLTLEQSGSSIILSDSSMNIVNAQELKRVGELSFDDTDINSLFKGQAVINGNVTEAVIKSKSSLELELNPPLLYKGSEILIMKG